MLVVGDKIKQTKIICGCNFLDSEFTVVSIDESNNIVFENSQLGRGYMTFDEFEKHFEKVIVKTPWSGWIYYWDDNSNIFSDGFYQFKTNEKKIILKKDGVKVKSSCNKTDTFNLMTGLELCILRWEIKKASNTLQQKTKELNIFREMIGE